VKTTPGSIDPRSDLGLGVVAKGAKSAKDDDDDDDDGGDDVEWNEKGAIRNAVDYYCWYWPIPPGWNSND